MDNRKITCDALNKLYDFEKQNTRSCEISEDGVLKYLFNSPMFTIDMLPYKTVSSATLVQYKFPRDGDILLDVSVSGKCDKIRLFTYDFWGKRVLFFNTHDEDVSQAEDAKDVVADAIAPKDAPSDGPSQDDEAKDTHLDPLKQLPLNNTINPFPSSGIPLVQTLKPVYLEIEGDTQSLRQMVVKAKYALLDKASKKIITSYEEKDDKNAVHGVKFMHESNTLFRTYNVHCQGQAVNCISSCNANEKPKQKCEQEPSTQNPSKKEHVTTPHKTSKKKSKRVITYPEDPDTNVKKMTTIVKTTFTRRTCIKKKIYEYKS